MCSGSVYSAGRCCARRRRVRATAIADKAGHERIFVDVIRRAHVGHGAGRARGDAFHPIYLIHVAKGATLRATNQR
jgi:hypothetical protein